MMPSNAFAEDWVATMLCALTDGSARGGSTPGPLGASLRELCVMIGTQRLYLLGADGSHLSLSEESAELLGFVDVLARRRAKSREEAQKKLPMLVKRQKEKASALKELRLGSQAIPCSMGALDRLSDYANSLLLFIKYVDALRANASCAGNATRRALANAEKKLLKLCDALYGQRVPYGLGAGREDLFADCLSVLEHCVRDYGDEAEAMLANMRARLSKTNGGSTLCQLLDQIDAFRLLHAYTDAVRSGLVSRRSTANAKLGMINKERVDLEAALAARQTQGRISSDRARFYLEYVTALGLCSDGHGESCGARLAQQQAGIKKLNDALKKRLKKQRPREEQLVRDLGDLEKEIGFCRRPLGLSITLTPMVRGRAVGELELSYNKEIKKYVVRHAENVDASEAMSLRAWVSWLETTYKADDVYLYLAFWEEGDPTGEDDGLWGLGMLWGEGSSHIWLVPADLSCYSSIYQSTGNPADYIYPVREYGAPFESFGNRRKVAFERLCERVEVAQRDGRAVYIPYGTDEESFLVGRDTFVVHVGGDGRVASLRSTELDRYRPVVPLRRYPRSEDGEVPVLCVDLEGTLWLVDLAAQRIELEPRATRDLALFDEGLEISGTRDGWEAFCSRVDCWCVAGNYDGRDEQGAGSLHRLEDGEVVRLRFFEICRDDGSYGNVLSRAERVLMGHRWQKDDGASVRNDAGREVECVWQTPSVEGFTLVGVQDLQRFILSFGSDVVVEGPDWLRTWHLRIALQNVRKLHARLFGNESE